MDKLSVEKMDRLSEQFAQIIDKHESCFSDAEMAIIFKVFRRFKQYENTELLPEEIEDICNRFAGFLTDMTNNRMSKLNYTLDAMIQCARDAQEDDLFEQCDYPKRSTWAKLNSIYIPDTFMSFPTGKVDGIEFVYKGECEMLEGNYKVALCRFLETKSNEPSDWDKLVTGQPFGKEYAYAVFPENEIKPYDYALVIANGSLKIVVIDEIIDKADWDGADVTKELICRVDTRPYIGRKECRKQAKKLKNQMDKMVKESQSILLYETLAAHNPELKTILDQYKNLTGYGDSK